MVAWSYILTFIGGVLLGALLKTVIPGLHSASARADEPEPMPCSHSWACLRQDTEGTAHCEACETAARGDVVPSDDEDTWKLQSLVVPTPGGNETFGVYSPADCTMDLVSMDADGYTVRVTWGEP